MIALLTHWRLGATCLAGIAAALLLALLQHERQARTEAERRLDEAQVQASAAHAQGELEQSAGAAAAAAQTRTVHIVTRSEEAAHAIVDLPGADQALPQPVRDGWLAGVRELRQPAAGAHSADSAGG
ncbi:MAG: hypothetical protein B7Y99_13220 [Caulobacterales bacterium 32-69-10]|nr:MAG: hypothetical protein B7Y99_13220 [Caulobacterales bacterium 32-69-10]